MISTKVFILKEKNINILERAFTVLTEMISTISLNNPCDTHSLNLTRGRQPKLLPSMSDSSSRTPDSVRCSPSPTLMLNRTLQIIQKILTFLNGTMGKKHLGMNLNI